MSSPRRSLCTSHVRSLLVPATLVAALIAPRGADAQSNSALAEKLFLEGQKLMETGDPAACGKFADSERLDPAVGTLVNLALCHEKQGKSATAWGEFTDAAAQAQKLSQHDREGFARAHAAALEKKLQKMIVEVARPVPGMEVTLDGAPLPITVLGTEIPLDPGDHELVVNAPGKKPWRQAKMNLGPSAVVTRVAVTLEDAAPTPAPAGGGGSTLAQPNTPPVAGSGDENNGSGKRTVGFLVGAVGLAGIAVGGVMLGLASSLSNRSDSEIAQGQVATGTNDHNAALSDQTIGFVAGGAGIVAVGVGLFLVLTSGSGHSAPPAATAFRVLPRVGPGGTGLELSATF
jgi:hypothetical protein